MLYLYGGGSTIEIYDAKTLEAKKMVYLNKDSTTNLIQTPYFMFNGQRINEAKQRLESSLEKRRGALALAKMRAAASFSSARLIVAASSRSPNA